MILLIQKIKNFYKKQKYTILVIPLIAGIALILYIFLGEELGSNIIAEAIWSAVTLICIDVIIETNNQYRRLPAKLLSYSRLIELNCEYLRVSLPDDAFSYNPKVYTHGEIYAHVHIELKTSDINELSSLIEKNIHYRSSFEFESFEFLNGRLNTIISTSASLFDDELFSMLLKWERNNTELVSMLKLADWSNVQTRKDIAKVVRANILMTLNVREWLMKEIDKNFVEFQISTESDRE